MVPTLPSFFEEVALNTAFIFLALAEIETKF